MGRGGLLGRHVEASLGDGDAWRPVEGVPWDDPFRAVDVLLAEAGRFLDEAALRPGAWRIAWCAGAGVVATSPEALARETAVVAEVLAALRARLDHDPALAARGLVFQASSAGGVYAASPDPQPFHEGSATAPLAPYGHEKLAQERLFRDLAAAGGPDVLIGRLSNLYGPGQSLSKPQGLISQIGRAALRREPIAIYVSLDTIRDYLFVADAGRMVAAALDRMEAERRLHDGRRAVVKVFASEAGSTVAAILGAWRQALGRPPLVALASRPVTALQPRALTFRSRVWPDLLGRPTLLVLGVEAVRRDQLARHLAGDLR